MLLTRLDPIVAPAPKIAINLSEEHSQKQLVEVLHTRITHLLPELLALLIEFARLARFCGGCTTLADIERHVAIVG